MSLLDTLYTFTEQIKDRLGFFLVAFFVITALSYGVLYALDFIPEAPTTNTEEPAVANADTEDSTQVTGESGNIEQPAETPWQGDATPNVLTIEKLGKTVSVMNPVSESIADLDEALLSGVVRHPASADFSQAGNIFILGHSSYLPNVLNKNFQAFNGIQELTWGDRINLESDDVKYTYRVEKVYEAKASEVVVPHTPGEKRLTLATCNSFGSTDDRYMVEAVLIDTHTL